eukprot:c55079_g1_i1 orf=390-1490(-)
MDGFQLAKQRNICSVFAFVFLQISHGFFVHGQVSQQLFPALFVFGDSLVDVGNNNYILTLARSNYKPYGVDFPFGATGRFTNGKTVMDVICDLLHLPLIPPYLAPTTRGREILNGVNYASAAAGILPRTGFNYIGRVDFDTQLEWFGNTVTTLKQLLGSVAAEVLVTRSLYTITFGSNDYINNYLLSVSPTSKQFTASQYQEILLKKFQSQLVQLYTMGARYIAISSLGPLGCIPSQLAVQKSVGGECSEHVNSLAVSFNSGLNILVQQLTANLPGAHFICVDTFNPVVALYNNPTAYGFQVNSRACCGIGKYGGQGPCVRSRNLCKNRDLYLFFDAFHPSQAANEMLGNILYTALIHNFFNASKA